MQRKWRVALLGGAGVVVVATAIGAVVLARSEKEAYEPRVEPASFTATIDNPYLPLRRGTRWVYQGTEEGRKERKVVEVTNEIQQVTGVPCVVVRDTVTIDGQVAEDTLDWYSQDADGNVWYFGEDSKDYENGKVVSTQGTWKAGVDGAQPGIVMKADPKVGDRYRQEYYPGEAEDWGEVLGLAERVTVPFGAFDRVLKTKDTTPLEPDVVEHKLYAQGVGLLRAAKVSGAGGQIDLIEMTKA